MRAASRAARSLVKAAAPTHSSDVGTTALHDHLASRGAVHADDRGVLLPARFGDDPAAEYRALRGGAALVDLGFRPVVRATGADRVAFLPGLLTDRVASLAAGAGRPALPLPRPG